MTVHPFLIPNPTALRAKIDGLTGLWKRRWEHSLACAEAEQRTIRWYGSHQMGDVPTYAAFAWVVTQEGRWAEIARRELLWLEEIYPKMRKGAYSDRDTWMWAAPMLRRAISLDWIWDSGALSPEEKDRFTELFITDSLKYSYIALRHRIPPHASNQGLAMSLNLLTVGCLFGVKRGSDIRARRLMEFGLPHLLHQVAALPPDAYSGEGSTYLCGVEAPLMALASAALEEVTGEDLFRQPFTPSGNSMFQALELPACIVPPSGVLPAWDHYRFMLGMSATPLAYLAHRTGDPTWYDFVAHGPGWERSGHFAWMRDGHVWQWLWMPDPKDNQDSPGMAYAPRSWVEPRVGGSLLSRDGDLHLFQMWDIVDPRPVRRHMNPNNLQLEAWQSLLTVDGCSTGDFPLDKEPRLAFAGRKTTSRADASIGAHSCILIDDLVDLAPHRSQIHNLDQAPTGRLLRHDVGDTLQVLSAEAAPLYSDDTDIESIVRTSALIDDRFWVIHDRVRAASEHAFTWQLVLRQGAVKTDYGARLRTQEHVVMDLLTSRPASDTLVDIPGYPDTLEKSCHHYRQFRKGHDLEMTTVLVPQLGREELADWSVGWQGRWDPEDRGEDRKWYIDAEDGDRWNPMGLEDAFFHVDVYPSIGRVWGFLSPDDPLPPDKTVVWFRREINIPVDTDGPRLLELPRGCRLQAWLDGKPLELPAITLLPRFVDITDISTPGAIQRLTMRISRQRTSAPEPRCRLQRRVEVAAPTATWCDDRIEVMFGNRRHTVLLERLRGPADATPIESDRTGADAFDMAVDRVERLVDYESARGATQPGDTAASRQQACVRALLHAQPDRRKRCAMTMQRQMEANIEPRTPNIEPRTKMLLPLLDAPDWVTRMLAVEALGAIRAVNAVPEILALLKDETQEKLERDDYEPRARFKEMCIEALGRIGDASAVPALIDCLDQRWVYGVRRTAAQALGRIGDPAAIPALEGAADDPDGEAAGAARRSLQQCRGCETKGE